MRMLMFVMAALGTLAAPAGAEQYWIAYEGNDFPENEGWTREINAAGGANRWIEDGALVIDSLHNAAIYDDYFIEGISDPGPGELFVAEWRVLSEEMLFWYDAGVTIARTNTLGYLMIHLGVEDILVRREWEHIPITPGEWHAYGVESEDMVEYTLSIDGEGVFTGLFEDQSLIQSFMLWGDMMNGAASLTRWDYVRFGVVPEPSAVWLVIAGLAACVLRTLRSGMRRVVVLPVLACLLAASATAEPYWIAYEGNDFPENEGWTRNINAAGGANRWIEDGALVIDSLHNAAIWDNYVIHGISDPGPAELFVAEWRVLSEDMLFWYDAGVVIARTDTPGHFRLHLGVEDILIRREWEHIPIAPGEWHVYRIETDDMVEYTLSIDGEGVFTGLFEDQSFLQSFLVWGDLANGAASLTRWDYVRFGVVPEPSSLTYCILAALVVWPARPR